MKYHLCVPISVGIEKLRKGENIFSGTPIEAFHALIDNQNAGKKYFTGCDKEDLEGRCTGHEDILTPWLS